MFLALGNPLKPLKNSELQENLIQTQEYKYQHSSQLADNERTAKFYKRHSIQSISITSPTL